MKKKFGVDVEPSDEFIQALKLCQKETIKRVFKEIERIKTVNNLIGVNATDLIEFNNKLRELKKRLLEEVR